MCQSTLTFGLRSTMVDAKQAPPAFSPHITLSMIPKSTKKFSASILLNSLHAGINWHNQGFRPDIETDAWPVLLFKTGHGPSQAAGNARLDYNLHSWYTVPVCQPFKSIVERVNH